MRISDWSSDVCSSDLERQPEIREYPISPIPLSQIKPFLRDLRIVESVDDLPYVISLDEGRLRSAAGQLIYVRGLHDAHNGDTYAVVRPTMRYARVDDDGKTVRGRVTDLDWRGKRSEEHTSELQALMRSPYAVYCLKK